MNNERKIYASRAYVDEQISNINSGVSSWNDLEDKPFGEEKVQTIIEWDGSTEGKDLVSPTENLTLIKISDELPKQEDLIGATLYLSDGNTIVITSDNIISTTDLYSVGDYTTTYLYGVQALSVSDINFPSIGLYAATGDIYCTKLEMEQIIVHTIDEKFIPDSIIAQSDWDQRDETALDFIKNKPFYMKEQTGVYLMQSKVRTYEPAGDTGYYYVNEALAAQPIVGNTYTVKINNRSYYSQQCKKFPDTSAEFYIGNVGLLGSTYEDTGETYLIVVNLAYMNGQSMIMSAVAADTSSSYIYGTALIPVTIDEKYLPDYIKIKPEPDWTENDYSSVNYIKNRTHWLENGTLLTTEPVNLEFNITKSNGSKWCSFSNIPELLEYNTYTVAFNGKLYETNGYRWDWDHPEEIDGEQKTRIGYDIVLGNSSLISDIGGYNIDIYENEVKNYYPDLPFCICYRVRDILFGPFREYELWDAGVYVKDAEPYAATVEIYEGIHKYHQLDERFIPDTIARVSGIPTLPEIPEINYPVTSVNGQTGDVVIDIPSTEGLATEEYVNSAITNINTYYTKAEIDNMEFITLDEIDAICARTIEVVTPTTGTF